MFARLRLALLALAYLYGVGQLAFAGWVFGPAFTTPAQPAAGAPAQADAVVALTGGNGLRIAEAGRLLTAGLAERMLISGVYPLTTDEVARDLSGLDEQTFSCCLDIGRVATTTRGNAEEVADWVAEHEHSSLIVVTSDFHVPRSLAELNAALDPNVTLTIWPVRHQADTPWWSDGDSVRRVLTEYPKFLAVLARDGLGLGRRAKSAES